MATTCFNCGTDVDPQASECPSCQAVLQVSNAGDPAPAPKEEGPNLRGILAKAGAAMHIPLFEEHGITAEMLPRLSNEDLKEMGITSLSTRLDLMDALKGRMKAKGVGAPSSDQAGLRSSTVDDWGSGGSLLDIDFSGFVTPRVTRTLYLISVILSFVLAGCMLFYALSLFGESRSGSQSMALLLLFLAPTVCYLNILFSRIGCEAILVLFRISGDLRALRQSRQ